MGQHAEDLEHEESGTMIRDWKEFVWTTRDGDKLKLQDMDTFHIKNCILMLERQIASRPQEDADGEPNGMHAQDAFHAEIRHNDALEKSMRRSIKIMQYELERRRDGKD